jgi:hypothetical protein
VRERLVITETPPKVRAFGNVAAVVVVVVLILVLLVLGVCVVVAVDLMPQMK